MRKSLIFVIVIISLFCFALPCAAQTVNVSGEANGDIYAKYTSALAGCYTDKVSGGSASITTDGGITISVKGAQSGLTLVVMPVLQRDTQAWTWFLAQMSVKVDKFMPFDIFFKDEYGNTVPVTSNIEVMITVPDGYTNPIIYNLFSDETLGKLNSAAASKTLTFTYSGKGYIVLASVTSGDGDPKDPSAPSQPGGDISTDPSNPGKIPDTGDNTNMTLWLLLGGATLIILICMLIVGRKKKKCFAKFSHIPLSLTFVMICRYTLL